MEKTFIQWLEALQKKNGKGILNQQKTYWHTKDKLFVLFSGGIIWECTEYYRKGGEILWLKAPEYLGKPIGRFIVKTKVNHALTVQTGRLHYN